jgi:aryl carrier-like protein
MKNQGRIAYFEAKANLLENNAKEFARQGRTDDAVQAGIDMVRAMSEATRLRIGLGNTSHTEGGDAA